MARTYCKCLLCGFGHHSSADGFAAFADGKAHTFFDPDGFGQIETDLGLIAWIDKTGFGLGSDDAGHIRGPKEELRLITCAKCNPL